MIELVVVDVETNQLFVAHYSDGGVQSSVVGPQPLTEWLFVIRRTYDFTSTRIYQMRALASEALNCLENSVVGIIIVVVGPTVNVLTCEWTTIDEGSHVVLP